MVKHIVMWKLNATFPVEKYAHGKAIKTKLERLQQSIPEIRSLEVGLNITPGDDAYDLVLYAEFESREALHVYQIHPAHLKFKEFIGPLRKERKVVDYEI